MCRQTRRVVGGTDTKMLDLRWALQKGPEINALAMLAQEMPIKLQLSIGWLNFARN